MTKQKFLLKTALKTLLLTFLVGLLNVQSIKAQGPGSPEAAGFEPVDATDMVNLTNGNLSYVLPLLNVEGFPVSLSYHAGITMDMQASWVGLGWYLNPGAINRSVTGTPDDWKSGVGINFNSYYNEENYYGVSVEVGITGAATVGVGMNWGGGQGLSGSVSATLGLGAGTGKMVQGGVSASMSTTGNASLGAGIGVQIGSFGAGASVSYSLKGQWNVSGNVGKKMGNNFVGGGLSSNGGMSVGANGNISGVKSSGGAGMSSDSFSQGDASIDTQSTGIAVPLVVLPITLGFSKTKVKINIKKGYLNNEWGALYSSDYYNITSGYPRINSVSNYGRFYFDYMVRTKSMDTYSTRLPQAEEEFISDYSKTIENINFTYMGYDSYNVAAQGIMGNMSPYVFKNANIYGKGQVAKNVAGEPIHTFWHHGTFPKSINKRFGRLTSASAGSYNNTDLHFYFNGQFTSTEKNDVNGLYGANAYTWRSPRNFDCLINEGNHSGTSMNNSYQGRAKSPNYIEVFTNRQIATGHAAARGLISPATIPNSDRDKIAKFDPDGIGAYKITSPDGKTYHFSLPVYHYEQVQRGQINKQEDNKTFDISNVNEKRQFTRYATHWLLTAITGSDYVDRPDPSSSNQLKTFNKEDYGYWVELEYGQWSDGYVWRTPYNDRVYNYNTNTKGKIEKKDKGGYSFGRKQLFYLDKINTKSPTALFVKELREDSFGKNLKFKYRNGGKAFLGPTGNGKDPNSLNYTNPKLHVREYNGVHYKREYSLKLSKIVLVDSDYGKNLSKNTNSNTSSNLATPYGRFENTYVPNSTCSPNWESRYFKGEYGKDYSYGIHNESKVLDVRDVSNTFIQNHALKVVELNHSYNLAKNSPSSSEVYTSNNRANGKLTLNSVIIKGKGGAEYMPATKFDYHMESLQNLNPNPLNASSISNTQIQNYVEQRKNSVDNWGFLQGTYRGKSKAMAWSLKEVTMPTGAKIQVNYEEDDYWMEAFARRYWEDYLKFNIRKDQSNNKFYIYIENEEFLSSNVLIEDFRNYFVAGNKVFIDFWLESYHRNNCTGRRHRGQVGVKNQDISVVSVTSSRVTLSGNLNELDKYRNSGRVFNRWYSYYRGSNTNQNSRGRYGQPCSVSPCGFHHHKLFFKLLANKVPEDETGGGLRVKELRTLDGSNTYKVQYDYSHPTENRSSGITSYAPVDGLKYVPYQTELPAPGVMYEYVTMKETSNSGEYYSKTQYRHHVLKPVFNIFNPNIEMEALDADAKGEDRIFWANVTENYGGLNGNNFRQVEAKKIDIHVNTALIGQIKSIENTNSQGHIMMRTENEYINGTKLNGTGFSSEPNKGYTKETFNSMKSIFQTDNDGKVVKNVKRLLSISSRTDYNNMLKKTYTHVGGQTSSVEYSDVDPWLGSFRKSETTFANGVKKSSYRVPAYEKYSAMRSKVLNHNNKNMLTQEVLNIDEYNGKTLNASITTWKDKWTYRDAVGNNSTQSGIWRKHKNFIWKDRVNASTGAYNTTITPTSNYFNWGTGTPTNNKWQNISEITKYTHWSLPVEVSDINNNFTSSKMSDNFSKVVASGNARYSEMYYSGAEYVASGNTFEGEIEGANYKTSTKTHTGEYAIKLTNSSQKGFRITGSVGRDHNDLSKDFRPGTYKVSVWIYNGIKLSNQIDLMVNGVAKKPSEKVYADSGWALFNYYITLNPNSNTDVYLKNKGYRYGIYLDDFRMHPISTSINSYVYDQETDELLYILDNNNIGTLYCYDQAGRLCSTYKELVNKNYFKTYLKAGGKNRYKYKRISKNSFRTGFKVVEKNRYKYKGISENKNCECKFGKGSSNSYNQY